MIGFEVKFGKVRAEKEGFREDEKGCTS